MLSFCMFCRSSLSGMKACPGYEERASCSVLCGTVKYWINWSETSRPPMYLLCSTTGLGYRTDSVDQTPCLLFTLRCTTFPVYTTWIVGADRHLVWNKWIHKQDHLLSSELFLWANTLWVHWDYCAGSTSGILCMFHKHRNWQHTSHWNALGW